MNFIEVVAELFYLCIIMVLFSLVEVCVWPFMQIDCHEHAMRIGCHRLILVVFLATETGE